MIEHFHFLRPAWLLALPLLLCALWLLRRAGYDSGNWRAVIDARLLPHLLNGEAGGQRGPALYLVAAVVALGIVALAGPTWEKRQQSVYQQQAALVVGLDLSRSMDATDVRPSRLVRARHKIADILELRTEGQSALLVYAADAFAVTPLTSDVETILALLPDLETGLMPLQGSRADRALERAAELFENAGATRGDLLLVTDGFSAAEVERLERLLERHPNIRVSVLAIGTAEGGPIPLASGDFLKDGDGDIVVVKMNASGLQRIAERGNGAFTSISADDVDVNTLNYVMESSVDAGQSERSDQSAELWRELGPGLLVLALPLAALAFRRGLLWMVPLCLLVLPPEADAIDWQSLWRNDDQRALQLFREGKHAEAASLFRDRDWQAAARYRAGDLEAAADDWQGRDDVDAAYNHATALAQQGQYQQALAAYQKMLEQFPQHEDANFNRKAIEDWLRQQPPQPSGQQSQQQQPQDGQQGESEQASQPASQSPPAQDGEESESTPGGQDEQPREQARQGDSEQQSGQQQGEQQAQNEAQAKPQQQEAPSEAPQAANDPRELANLDRQMSEQATQQWLRKIPDDPGGLLRRKFLYQYRQRGGVDAEQESW